MSIEKKMFWLSAIMFCCLSLIIYNCGSKPLAGGTYTTTDEFSHQECPLLPGWNHISWNVDTPSDDVTRVFASVMSCTELIVGRTDGQTGDYDLKYDPANPGAATLLSVDHKHGYAIRIKDSCSTGATLSLDGLPVAADTPLTLKTGTNFVSYLPQVSLSPTDALASIWPYLVVVTGFDLNEGGAMTYDPKYPQFNSLIEMKPCRGYDIMVNQDTTLSYPLP